ncbi:uncharacterized membrane protein YoaK (UPF0700 family) [Asanoa ferruginea]|uniref:Uncharacterized membrane protein YoaK (UPF0700 family) n=1 Tax=Asanoa ferruginea TaxID=53367 RepID=A0A3E0A1Q2_9ACTN|nr:DUF1275 family protein [Asanoa ferruginea]REG00191.1 uncharacterized membrane protein YoaK (UPF0700 family) [Asanoa ferruginea]
MVLARLARRGGRRVTSLSLAACAGAVDLLAIAGLGGAFASIITGNLVTAGLGIGTINDHAFAAPAVAVAGYAAGVALALLVPRFRWPGHLLVELALLAALTAGWIATDGEPGRTTRLLLLATASVAMGTQSVVAGWLHESTTYLTGTLTGAVHDLVTGRRGTRAIAIGQLAALTAGATVAAALFEAARWAVPLLALFLLLVAIVGHRVVPQ